MNDRDPLAPVAHGVPRVAVSSASTRENRTGSWKYARPRFQDGVAPCNHRCPVGIDLEACMNLLGQGKLAEAADLLLRENPLPATTGRVCDHPCEGACNRASFDQAVAIHAVERALGDFALLAAPPPVERLHSESVAVVGSGPAGISCAYHLARLGYGVTVYEAESRPGGLLRHGIPEYRLPRLVLDREIDRLLALGIEIRCGVRVRSEGELARHEAVFLATGRHRSRPLGIAGEDLPGVLPGLAFLREVNLGHAPRLGRNVVVVGGGNTAMDCARTARRLGAEVVVLYRRGRAEMPAHAEEVAQAVCEGVRLELLAAPVAIVTASSGPWTSVLDAVEASFGEDRDPRPTRIAGVDCARMQLGPPDASGRRTPVPLEGSEFFVAADSVLTGLGEEAELELDPGLLDGAAGLVRVNALGGTGKPLVFAGGDLVDQPHTVAYAIGSGKRAAIGIDLALRARRGETTRLVDADAMGFGPGGTPSLARWGDADPVRRVSPVNQVVGPAAIQTAHFVHDRRRVDRFRPAEKTKLDFDEANLGLRLEEALAEAGRCFHCGVCDGCEVCVTFCPDVAIARGPDGSLVIDDDHCKGCGICAAECPRGAITMTGVST
jgi:NADPH-dependent glutamate synthase beta subunit-like oxidoreductase